MVVIKRKDTEGNIKELKINRNNVRRALVWLCANNELYLFFKKLPW